jgi:hypothetical protein
MSRAPEVEAMTFSVNNCVLAGRISDYGVKLGYLPSG